MGDDFCRPRGRRRIERDHAGQTGLIVCGRFEPFVYWRSVDHWSAVRVRIDGQRDDAVRMWEAKPGPYWIGLTPGQHTVDFRGDSSKQHRDGYPLRTESFHVAAGHAVIISFKTPVWRPFMSPTEQRWCSRPAW